MTAFKRAAQAAFDCFEVVKKDVAITRVRLKSERLEWVRKVLWENMPDYGDSTDLMSEMSRDAIEFMIDNADDVRSAHDLAFDFSEGQVDGMYVDLVAWLGMNPTDHGGWCTESLDEFGLDIARGGLWNIIQLGQSRQAQTVYTRWVNAIDDASSEYEQEDEE